MKPTTLTRQAAYNLSRVLGGLLVGSLMCSSQTAEADTYEVGPGQTYAAIGDVPWESLHGGDLVLIHWRDTPYHEKWSISVEGTADAPFEVRGVPGPGGALPVVDGSGAVTRSTLSFWNQDRGVLRLGGASVPAVEKARHVVIENLEIVGAQPSNAFMDASGTVRGYSQNAAALFIDQAENVTVRNCILHGSANGLFALQAVDLLVEGSSVFDNGLVGSPYEHNVYTQAIGLMLQRNYFGPLAAGALGHNIKDRSAGSVIRYNWIEGGNRQLDLVDSEVPEVSGDPRYRTTYVYGNVLMDPNGDGHRQIVQYGGDSGDESTYRKGVLHFYNNTVVSFQDIRMTAFRLSSSDETVEARNNIFFGSGGVTVLDETGTANLSRNWLSEGWWPTSDAGNGVVNGGGTSLVGTDPGFVSWPAHDFELSSESPCVDSGGALAPDVYPDHVPADEYVSPASWRPRPVDTALDIGAYERPGGVIGDVTIGTAPLAAGVQGSPYSVTLVAAGGVPPYRWSTLSGVLPAGLYLDETTGTIGGVPTVPGTYPMEIGVADAQQPPDVASRSLVIEIVESAPTCESALARIADLESQLAAAQQEKTALTEQVASLVSANDLLQDDLVAAQARIVSLESEVSTLTAEGAQLREQVASLIARMDLLSAQLTQVSGALSAGLITLRDDFRIVFKDPGFVIPGDTPVGQFDNLVSTIVQLPTSQKKPLYRDLAHPPRDCPKKKPADGRDRKPEGHGAGAAGGR